MNIKENFVGILLLTMVALYLPVAGTVKSKIAGNVKTENITSAKAEASLSQNLPESKLPSLVGEFLGQISTKEKAIEKWQLTVSEGSPLKIERQTDQSKQQTYWADPATLKNARFMIATLPDPIDSHTEWLFDQFIDAIQRAVEYSDYQLDRYWLPWKRDSKLNEHRDKPGIILFRKESSPLLILYIVGETPTSGIHKLPFEIALSEIKRYAKIQSNPTRIDILGPSFSGSVTSIRNAIQSWLKANGNPSYDFHFVSGSSTAISKNDFENLLGGLQGSVQFHTTIRKDDDLFVALLRAINWQATPLIGNSTKVGRAGQIALLTESSTAYGQYISASVNHPISKLYDFPNLPKNSKSPECKSAIESLEKSLNITDTRMKLDPRNVLDANFLKVISECKGSLDEKDLNKMRGDVETIWAIQHLIVLPFPLHISGVRNEYEKNRTLRVENTDKIKNPVLGLDLSLNEEGEPQDVMPSMSPQITSSTSDLVLANIFSTINKQDVRYVGLFATDTRDKLFLAEQIRLYCPNVQLFTTDSDLLYSHPKYVKFTHGMIVASTYPGIYLNKKWTAGNNEERKDLQFANSSSFGVFNATLALLNDPNIPLMEYGSPGSSKNDIPPVWLTAVGYRGPIPLWFLPNTGEDYLYKRNLSQTKNPDNFRPPESQFLNILLFLLCTLALAHFMGFVYQNPNEKSSRSTICRWWFETLRMTDAEKCVSAKHLLYLFLLFLFLFILSARLTTTVFLWSYEGDQLLKVFAYVTVLFMFITSGYLTIRIVMCPKNYWLRTTVVLIWVPVALYVKYLFLVKMHPITKVFFYLRAGDPISGLSPLVPLLLFSTVIYLWLLLQIKRIYLLRTSNIKQELFAAAKIANGELKEIGKNVEKILSKTVFVDPLVAPILIFVVGVTSLHVGHRFLPTLEGARFNLEFKVLLLASFIFVLVGLSKFIVLSHNLIRLTKSLAARPFSKAFSKIPDSLTKDLGKDFYIKRPTLQQLALTKEGTRRILFNHPDVEKFEHSLSEDLNRYGTEQAWSNNSSYRNYSDLWMIVESETRIKKSKNSKWKETAEQFLAIRMVFFFREIFIHLRNYLAFSTIGAMLMLGAISYYPIQPKRLLMMFLISLILAISGYAFFFFIQMNRDEILSRLFGTKINKVSWDKSFIIRIVVYVLIPILTLIAAQFPEVGSLFASALDPIQRALP